MRKKIQELYDKLGGRDIYVIGGGPSLNESDVIALQGKHVIAINTACKLFPKADALYWCDSSWADNNEKYLTPHETLLRFTKRDNADHYIKSDTLTTYGACVLKHTGNFGIDWDVNNVRGNNGGAQVLNLCANLKPTNIILLGFDMRTIKNKSNWHDEHICKANNEIYASFLQSINSMAPELKSKKISVIYCTPSSALKCFPVDSLSNWI